jgi:hypothetical protein
MSRQPFSMLRAAFWMLAAIVAVELLSTMFALAACGWMLLTKAWPLGSCADLGPQIREVWSEALAAILALLLAARGNGNGPKPPPGGTDGPTP